MTTAKKIEIAAIVAAATIGEGVFALPYVIARAGWLLSLAWFVALIAAVSVAHIVYLRTLIAVNEKERLLGLARKYFGRTGFWIGFLAIVIGLLLGFVAYLILGEQFVEMLLPGLTPSFALAVFWFILAVLVWGSEGKVAGLEAAGIALITCAIVFIFFTGDPAAAFAKMPAASPGELFLPFGAVIFALAGWTSVEQVYEIVKRHRDKGRTFLLFVGGTALAAVLYWLFALGVIGSLPAGAVAQDTISGIASWPVWRRDILAVIGLAAVFVVSLPISRALRGAMEKDLGWNAFASRALIILLPIAAVLAGFTDFLAIVSVAGGIFLATQYILIISVGRRTLILSRREQLLLDALTLVFVCAAVYEIARFVVH